MTSTTSDLALLGRKLGAKDYEPEVYVKEITHHCVGGHELHQQRSNIQTLLEDTHLQLKKNVYQNYGQFIDTAKEISYLESEMYQLAHMITEQRNLLHELMDASVLGDKPPLNEDQANYDEDYAKSKVENPKEENNKTQSRSEFEEGRRKLFDLLEKVEGCSHVTDVPTRYILHDGDLVEMDISENTALHRVHGYLTNDGFMVATWLPNRRGAVRFKYSCFYELDSLAVVNVRDFGGIKYAFKLLVFPDARLFQCANSESKLAWMEAFEGAKRNRQKQQDEIALKRSDTIKQREAKSNRKKNLFPTMGHSTESSKNPFDEESEDDMNKESQRASTINSSRHNAKASGSTANPKSSESTESADDVDLLDIELPEWLQELSDDLEVYIAQREFEEAVEVIKRATEFCRAHSDSALVREAGVKLETRKKQLIDVLTKELQTDKSIRGGPRAARRAVHLLIKLDRSTLACDLFLQHRAALLHSALKSSGKMESATIPYIQRQSVTFFNGILESSVEFRKAFQKNVSLANGSSVIPNGTPKFKLKSPEESVTLYSKKTASLLTWVEEELERFCNDRIDKQVFSPSTPLETIATCMEFVRIQAKKLKEAGLDVVHLFDAKFRRNIERSICEHRDKHVEAVKLRAQEDKWEAINCFNRPGTERFVDEMSSAGIPSIRSYVYDECWVALTRNTTSFAISYLNFADSLLKLFNPSTRALANESLVTVFHSHLRHIEQAVRSDRLKKVEPKFVQRNSGFLLDTLLSLIEHKYQEKTDSDCPKLGKLHSSYSWLKDGTSKPPSSKERESGGAGNKASEANVSKYTDPNYV